MDYPGYGQFGVVLPNSGLPWQMSWQRKLMLPTRDRLHLLTLSACRSGAASLRVARGLLGLDDAQGPTRLEETGQQTQFPSLGQDLARAVLAMRFPVGDRFAADLAFKLYEHMLSHRQPLSAALRLAMHEGTADQGARFAPSLSVATLILFGPRAAATALIPPQQPEFDLQPTGMFRLRRGTEISLVAADAETPGVLHAHPLVREHFAERLTREHSVAWRAKVDTSSGEATITLWRCVHDNKRQDPRLQIA